jgi:polysaccharide biosynthesis protein PslA
MVEFQAPHGATRGWSFLPNDGGAKLVLLSHGRILCTLDFLVILVPPALTSLLSQSTETLTKNLYFWSLLALFSILLTASHGGYVARAEEQQRLHYGVTANCFLATSVGMLTLAIILGHPNILARQWVMLDLVATPFLLIGVRTMLTPKFKDISRHHAAPGPIVICYDVCPHDLAKTLINKNLSAHIAGVLYLSLSGTSPASHGWPQLRDLAALRAILMNGKTRDVIFIHHPALDRCKANINHALWEIVLAYPARIWLAFEVASNLPDVLREKSGEYTLVPIVTDEFLNSNNLAKRIFDIAAASILLALVSPLLVICACLIRAGDTGPVIFRQQRTGAQGRQFEVLKFRTMTYDPARTFMQASRNDPRITGVGQWLRRTSLDELPQLLNVVRGDMSLVGPRPHAPETQVEGMSFENALKLYQIRHRVKPGITGLAQIRGQRGATPVLKNLELRLASDLEYIQSWSIWLDLSILVKTLPAVLLRTNAW